jgi:hypothetical protein
MKKTLTAALAAAALAVIPATAAMADSHETAQVSVVHGVPDLDVDVFADGEALLEGFSFTDIVTTDLPAGTYSIAVAPAGDGVDAAVLGPIDVTVEAGNNYAIAAHLDADGGPTATVFAVNDAEGISAFHTAAFPAVAIVAGGDIAADDLTNGNAAQLDLEAGTELPGVGVAAAGSTDIALEAGDVTIPEGQRILAFAVGTPDDESLQLVTEVIDVSAAGDTPAPDAVDAGTGGALNTGLPMWVAALMALGALGLAAPAAATARRRS